MENNILMALECVDVLSEPCTDKVREIRMTALRALIKQTHAYVDLGYSDKIITAIIEKKTAMIRKITTKRECEALSKPHAPHFDGVKFITDEFWIPEEELIGWSETSLKAPLNDTGYKRYAEVFKMVYPERYEEIFKGRI